MGRIVFDDEIVGEIDNGQLPMDNYAAVNYVDRVSCKEIISYLPDGTSQCFPLSTSIAQLNSQLSNLMGCLSPTARVTRIPATQLCRISARQWRTRNFPSLESAWATSCSRKPEGQRFTNLNMDTVATTSRYAWWVRNVVLLLRRIMVMR